MADQLNHAKHPVGTRFLGRRRIYESTIYEATVDEWSPSGSCVRLTYKSGNSCWTDDLPYVVELLVAKGCDR